jgi:hypothetical protein
MADVSSHQLASLQKQGGKEEGRAGKARRENGLLEALPVGAGQSEKSLGNTTLKNKCQLWEA